MAKLLYIACWWLTFTLQAEQLVTLNCYWFLGPDARVPEADKPQSIDEYDLKAKHLVDLLPEEPPLLVALQEVGSNTEVSYLSVTAESRYHQKYAAVYVPGNDVITHQEVRALLNLSQGWGLLGQPSRHADLDKDLSKHMVFCLTNSLTSLEICIVQLRRPLGIDGVMHQKAQLEALLRWVMRHQSNNPQVNLMILGDFNEGRQLGDSNQNLKILFQAKPPLIDPLSYLTVRVKTHMDGLAPDRILISEALLHGYNRYRVTAIRTMPHSCGYEDSPKLFTDHFPVAITLDPVVPTVEQKPNNKGSNQEARAPKRNGAKKGTRRR